MAVPTSPPERRMFGIVLRCGAASAFALMGALLKAASEHGAGIVELVFYRSLGALPIVSGWVLMRGGIGAIATRQPLAHLTRSAIGLVSLLLTFATLSILPLAQATTLSYSAPITATILSAVVLREAVGARRALAVLVGFLGVVLVADPFGARMPLLGIATGIGASFGQGAVMITLRQISRTESTSAIVFWFSLLTTLATGLTMPLFGMRHDPAVYALLIPAGMIGGVGQLAMTGSLRFAPVATVVPFDYLQIIWATAIGWIVFATPAPATLLAGAALIAGSGIYTALRERRRGIDPAQALATPEA